MTTLALLHSAYFILPLESLAWSGEEDGGHLLSSSLTLRCYFLFQVRAGSKARIGAEASFLFPCTGDPVLVYPVFGVLIGCSSGKAL